MPRRTRHTSEASINHEAMNEVADESAPEEEEPRRIKAANASNTKRNSSKIKKEKAAKSRTRRNASENDLDLGLTAPFDRDKFLAAFHPVSSEGTRTIEGVGSDFKTVLDQLEHTGFQLVLDTAMAIEEVSGQTEEGQEVSLCALLNSRI